MENPFHVSHLIATALSTGQPVVALESTVITHGLPYPQNVETALAMEAAVRIGGALPATIAVLKGRLTVGLAEADIERLGKLAGKGVVRKCSRRDLSIAIALGEDAATTVAGTMVGAHLAGIELFATGGIGGVHRGHPFDVSADLRELGKTPVTVVCSGAKSILDLPATREMLETEGVAIVGYGVDELPAFFARSSGLSVDVRLDSAASVAKLIAARRLLDLQSAILVTIPPPQASSMDAAKAEAAAEQAAREADEVGVHGPAATPWLLSRMAELTGGESMEANTALLQNNARIAAEIAVALSRRGPGD